MEFKGTQGKWSVGGEFRKPRVITDISKDHICEINQVWTHVTNDDGSGSSVGQSHNKMLATAKLIAAAPELLEALQEITKKEGAYSEDRLEHANNTIMNLVEIAEQAIEKALK